MNSCVLYSEAVKASFGIKIFNHPDEKIRERLQTNSGFLIVLGAVHNCDHHREMKSSHQEMRNMDL